MIRIKDLNADLLKLDKKSWENIDIDRIGRYWLKDTDYVNIHSINPLYFIVDKADGYIGENNGNKYLTLTSNDKNKELLIKENRTME